MNFVTFTHFKYGTPLKFNLDSEEILVLYVSPDQTPVAATHIVLHSTTWPVKESIAEVEKLLTNNAKKEKTHAAKRKRRTPQRPNGNLPLGEAGEEQ